MKLQYSRLQLLWIGLPLFALAAIESDTRAQTPSTRMGIWEVQGSADGRAYTRTDCRNPMDEVKHAIADLQRAGCNPGAPQRTGEHYSYELACIVKNGNGTRAVIQGSMIVSLRGDSDFTFAAKARAGDQRHYEMVQAKRLGDCETAANAPAAASDSPL